MKRYVFLIASLSNLGGAQFYVRNKLLYLRELGWSVTVLTARANNVLIPELKEFQNIFPELSYQKYYYSCSVQKRKIEQMAVCISDCQYTEIVIESTSIIQSVWAEELARVLGAKHFAFPLQEQLVVSSKALRDFFVFKYKRHELAGITNKSLANLFESFYPINPEQSYSLVAYGNNVEADIDSPWLHTVDRKCYDYVVGAFSRMNKPFVFHAVDDFCNYASKHCDKKFLFLWIGDAPADSPILEQIKKRVSSCSNVKMMITGFLFPVPTKLLEHCDVFVSSSGCSCVCERSGVPTITYDSNDFSPIGILGRTTNNYLFRDDNEPPQNLDELMDKILIEKQYLKLPANYNKESFDFQSHLDFLYLVPQPKVYYDVNKIYPELNSEKKMKVALFILGPRVYTWLHNLRWKIKAQTKLSI